MKKFDRLHPEKFSSIREMIRRAVKSDPNHTAYVYKKNKEQISVSNDEFYTRLQALGAKLCSMGFSSSHIACVAENSFNWILTFTTSLCTSGVFVPIDKELPIENIVYLLNDSKSEIVFCQDKFERALSKYENELPNVKYFVTFERTESEGKYLSFSSLIESGKSLDKSEFESLTNDENALKYLVYTSGTTGVAKGVMLTEHNICSAIYYGMRISHMLDRGLSVLPYNHTYEAVCDILVAIHSHTTLCINDSLRRIQENMKLFKPEFVMLVPAFTDHFYSVIKNNIEKKGMTKSFNRMIKFSNSMRKVGIDLRRKLFAEIHRNFGGALRRIVCGGAPIRSDVSEFFDNIGISVTGGYGITECSPLVSLNHDEDNNIFTAGRRLECIEWKIDKPDENGIGEILIKGDVVMKGYYNRPDLTSEALKDGWFYTGDYGYITEKDEIVITGRKKNIIVMSNGKNIYPEELEQRIAQIPYITEVVVSADKNEFGQDIALKALVYIEDENIDVSALSDDVKKACDGLPPYKRVSKVERRSEPFEKTTTNKIKRTSD
ncbi:MAG: AMP-binding protein [Clostridia bacterium]|nr:AMP-binding protein [Clostridia bacterium]